MDVTNNAAGVSVEGLNDAQRAAFEQILAMTTNESTLFQQESIFGYNQGTRYELGDVFDVDFIDRHGKYLTTLRADMRRDVPLYLRYTKSVESLTQISDSESNFKLYPIEQ